MPLDRIKLMAAIYNSQKVTSVLQEIASDNHGGDLASQLMRAVDIVNHLRDQIICMHKDVTGRL